MKFDLVKLLYLSLYKIFAENVCLEYSVYRNINFN